MIAAVTSVAACGVVSSDPPAVVAAPPSAIAPIGADGPTGFARTFVTFYAAYDNDPPGSTDIAYGNERHARAGGTGTFDDPLTFATDPNELPPGTIIYYPAIKKYFVMEDDCAECIDEWKASKHPHVDLWSSATTDRRVLGCEAALTPDGLVTIEVNPRQDRPVDPRPLFDETTGKCWTPSPTVAPPGN